MRTILQSPTLWILSAGVLLGVLTLTYTFGGNDIPLFLYIGDGLLHGIIPYRDAWDVTGPGIFLAFGICSLFFGTSGFAVHLFDLVWQTVTALVLTRIAGRVFRHPAAGLIAGLAYLIAYFSQPWWNLATSNGLISLPVAVSILALVRAMENDRLLFWALAGAAVGVAVLFKMPFGLLGIPMIACALGRGEPDSIVFRRLAPLAAGFAGPLVLCAGFFYMFGALDDLLKTQFVYAPEYVHAARERLTLACVTDRMVNPQFRTLHVMAVVVLAFVGLRLVRTKRISRLTLVLLGWLLVAAAALALHGLFLEYHFLPLIAPLAVLSAGAIFALAREALASRRLLYVSALVLVVCFFGYEPAKRIRGHARNTVQALRGRSPPESPWVRLGRYLRDHTPAETTIFVWGNAASVYLHARRKPASRFLGIWPFALPVPEVGYREVFLREFEANKPDYFVLVKYPPEPPGPPSGCLLPIDPNAFNEFEQLNKIVAAEYRAVEETPQYILFRHQTQTWRQEAANASY
jgi:hypothetical protein